MHHGTQLFVRPYLGFREGWEINFTAASDAKVSGSGRWQNAIAVPFFTRSWKQESPAVL